MSPQAGPPPVVLMLGEHPVHDRYVVPCQCRHEYREHTRYGGRCKGLDSYGIRCLCPSYDRDANDLFYRNDLVVKPEQRDYR